MGGKRCFIRPHILDGKVRSDERVCNRDIETEMQGEGNGLG